MKTFKAWLSHLLSKYVGKIEYVVTIVNVSGNVNKEYLSSQKELDIYVADINAEKYWDVQRVEKFRRYSYKYHKEVLHSPLHFCIDNVTEMQKFDDYEFSVLKKDESLTNVRLHKR